MNGEIQVWCAACGRQRALSDAPCACQSQPVLEGKVVERCEPYVAVDVDRLVTECWHEHSPLLFLPLPGNTDEAGLREAFAAHRAACNSRLG